MTLSGLICEGGIRHFGLTRIHLDCYILIISCFCFTLGLFEIRDTKDKVTFESELVIGQVTINFKTSKIFRSGHTKSDIQHFSQNYRHWSKFFFFLHVSCLVFYSLT